MKDAKTEPKTIIEYGGFVCGDRDFDIERYPGFKSLAKSTFDDLEKFILTNKSKTGTEAAELLSISVRRGLGKVITAQNYVGVITMRDGTVIEILPKIHCDGNINETERINKTKRIFLETLRSLKDIPFKKFNASNLKINRNNILEVFISMFVSEVSVLVKQGLRSFYNSVEENERFFKGKLNVSQNIRHNHIHKERFYVQYDEWSINRPENRLLKTTLRFLRERTSDARNRYKISRLLTFFDGVDVSTDRKADFSKCAGDRGTSHYQDALLWCVFFLCGNSFTPFAGGEAAVAFLFPMEKVFESYAAAKLRRVAIQDSIRLRTQDKRYSLFDNPAWAFGLRPDMVLEKNGNSIVIDTKWKILSNNEEKNYGISQDDMYQMYAYGKRYKAKEVVLLYPRPEGLSDADIQTIPTYFENRKNRVKVKVAFIDLSKESKEIEGALRNLVDLS